MANSLETLKAILSPPGDTIQEAIDAIGMSQVELAERMGRPKEKVNDIIKGREPISTATAFQLEKVLGIPASFWLNRETEYRKRIFELEEQMELGRQIQWLQEFPISTMKKLGWLPQTRENYSLVNSLLAFFSIASVAEWDKIYVKNEVSAAFRISLANISNPHSISVWLRKGELDAKKLSLSEFDKRKFKDTLPLIKELAFENRTDFAEVLQKICSDCGVAVVYTPNLPKAPISGAARWVHNTPIIQLSGRYKTDDHFWFTFFHEAGHIIEHGKKDIFLESVEGAFIDYAKEEEANEFASNWLLTETQLEEILRHKPFSESKIRAFSEKFRTPPGVIVGRLQSKKLIPHSTGNHLRKEVKLFQ